MGGKNTSSQQVSILHVPFHLCLILWLQDSFFGRLEDLFWEGEQKNRQFWPSMHFPLRQWSDLCPLSLKVDLVIALHILGTVSPNPIAGSLRGRRLHMSLGVWKGSWALPAAPFPSSFPVAVLSVTLSFLKAESLRELHLQNSCARTPVLKP